ncbi:hypothetical protein HIM_07637 [Hirsutella minnesotensis 3608]|uniref:GPI anchored serine-rich protein n=1 Tax=Hirsutella minnesotensis 3608 TaxID=1043627 RepID=A0A0F7ZN36_9HYPO|nr:hypothetical protein HIM_07637 [Hirsutella minnesotensis 3608]
MHSAALVPLVAAAAATLVAGHGSSDTITETATSTRFLTVTECHPAVTDCPAASPSNPAVQPSAPLAGPVSVETPAVVSVPASAPPASWSGSNSTSGAGAAVPSGQVTVQPSDKPLPTVPAGGANGVHPHTGVVAAAVAAAALLAAC